MRIIHRPRTHPAAELAWEAADYVVGEYVKAQKRLADHNAAAAARTERAAEAARRSEAAADAEWDRLVSRHRKLSEEHADVPADPTILGLDDRLGDLKAVLSIALSGFVLDEEAQEVVAAVVVPWVEAALQQLPQDAGWNSMETVIVGATVRLIALHDRATRARSSA